jgi:hypothetical protein
VNVNGGRVFKRLTNRVWRDLIEHHAIARRALSFELLLQVEADGFAFAIRIGCEIDRFHFLGGLL